MATNERPKKFGSFDIDADGTLSLHGQQVFPVYGAHGGLCMASAEYKWDNDARAIVETIVSPDKRTTRVVWTEAEGGNF